MLATLPPQRDVPYIVFPVLLWAAIRFGPRGAATATLVVCSITVWNTAQNDGPFVRDSITDSLLATQLFIAISALTSLLLAAVTAERTEATMALTASESSQRTLAGEQAALRRVATLVASAAPPTRVFEQVTKEVSLLLGVHGATLVRYEGLGAATVVGGWSDDGTLRLPVGSTIDLEGDSVVATVLRSGSPQRVEYAGLGGAFAEKMHELRLPRGGGRSDHRRRAALGCAGGGLPRRPSCSRRATSRSSATSPSSSPRRSRTPTPMRSSPRRAPASSRPATPSAGGSSATCTTARSSGWCRSRWTCAWSATMLEKDPAGARERLAGAQEQLAQGLAELRELARGIHPAVLTDRGLGPALESLAMRAPVPVEIEELPDERLAGPVEAAAYYVVAEAMTNVAKYAHASHATVSVRRSNGLAKVTVADDGVGGADPALGNGLRGLADRVAALDGHLDVESPAASGTRISAEIPCA